MVALSSQSSPESTTPSHYKLSHASTSTAASSSTGMNAADGLQLMREGPEATVQKLRAGLHEMEQRDATAKSALAKCDAVILELRSSIRTLKRQCENLEAEKAALERNATNLEQDLQQLEELAHQEIQKAQDSHTREIYQLQAQLQNISAQSHSSVVGELQVQLDRAHAQILTADMVRKELEDTLEAEQYTWELRVQDQERQLSDMMDECATLREDLDQCRSQWKEAEVGWTQEVQDLSKELESAHRELNLANKNDYKEIHEKLTMLESERTELQGCLDEAMQELEAVDQEIRTSPNVLGRLHNLYNWLSERSRQDAEDIPADDVDALLQGIQTMVEHGVGPSHSDDADELLNLQNQISVYRGDLKAREESAAELRSSLKEAVALLKPLQDAVHKTDMEKQALEQELVALKNGTGVSGDGSLKDQTINDLEYQVQSLQQQLSLITPERGQRALALGGGEPSSAGKKREKEEALQQLLSSTQSRFQELNRTNSEVVAENNALQKRLQNDREMKELEEQVQVYQHELQRKDDEIVALREELERRPHEHGLDPVEHEKRTEALEAELELTRRELTSKNQVEHILNNSLKEALSLLRPLQMHLETAEREKKDMSKKMKLYKKQLAKWETGSQANESMSVSSEWPLERQELQQRLLELQQRTNGAEKLRSDFVELNSRYDVTQNKLESAIVENQALADALKQREQHETEMIIELKELTEKMAKSEHELENAKYIATSALMKVEELTSEHVLQLSMEAHNVDANGTMTDSELQEKIRYLEQEVESAKELNETLQQSIQERDSILESLAEQRTPSRSYGGYQSPQQNGTRQGSSGKGVTWDNSTER
jgi:chromosome segregation ATPase